MRVLPSLLSLSLGLSAVSAYVQERTLEERALQIAEGSVSDVAARSTVDDIWDAIVNAADCAACQVWESEISTGDNLYLTIAIGRSGAAQGRGASG